MQKPPENETCWDLRPFAAVLQCLAPGQTSLTGTRNGNYKRLKITRCRHTWGKFEQQRDQKVQLPLLTIWEQKQGAEHTPCTHVTKGVGKPWSHPSGSTPGPSTYKEPACVLGERAPKGNCCLFSFHPAAGGAPVKPCLNFLSGL